MSMTLAQRLIHARASSGFTKVKPAADLAGITPSALYQLESGKTRSLSGDTAEKLATVYQGFRIEWLISGTGPQMHSAVAESPGPYQSHPPRLDAATLAASIRLVRKACELLEVSFDPEDASDATLVLLGGAYLIEREERDVTADNVVDFTKRLRERMRGSDGEPEHVGNRRIGDRASEQGAA